MIRTFTLCLALAGAVAALAAPAGARPIDQFPLDAAGSQQAPAPRQDLRSPDTRDAARALPDARDAVRPPTVVVVPARDARRPAEADAFDWRDAALGSGAAAAVLLLGATGTLALLRGRAESRNAARV